MLYFISDLHLSDATPETFALFRAWLTRIAREGGSLCSSLYILGDLFDAWIGDDDDAPFARETAQLLRQASEKGLRIYFQRGNRDFLVGQAFARAAGLEILPDDYLLEASGKKFLLTHGDLLCTNDADYQQFRQQVQSPEWQRDFLCQPLARRREQAAALRAKSRQEKNGKADYLMDVSQAAIERVARQYGSVVLLHGHTHRPLRQEHTIAGLTVNRWVLAEWTPAQGEALVWDGESLSRQSLTAA